MLHLTKKIYLDYVDYFSYDTDSFVVQDGEWARAEYDETYGEIITGTKSKVWGVCKTADELLMKTGDFGSFVKKFSGSKADGKLIIYCDEKAFQKLAIRWWKSLLPHASADDIYDLFLEYKTNKLNSTVIVKGNKTRAHAVHERYYDLSKEDFTKIYDSSEKFTGLSPELASIEFQLASYLHDPHGPWSAALFKKVNDLYKQAFYYQVISLKTEVEERLLNLHELYPEDFDNPAFEMSVSEIIGATGLSFIGDYRFNHESWKDDYIERNYGLKDLCKALLRFYVKSLNIKFPEDKFSYDDMQYTDARYLYLYEQSGEFLTAEQVIEEEGDLKTEDLLFKHLTRTDKGNEYLLLKVLRLAKLDRRDELKKYHLQLLTKTHSCCWGQRQCVYDNRFLNILSW